MARCLQCHHGRADADTSLGPYWCALQRLADPKGKVIVYHQMGNGWRFNPNKPTVWTVSRSQSIGPVEGFSIDWRTGTKHPHYWNRCAEFSPAQKGPAE